MDKDRKYFQIMPEKVLPIIPSLEKMMKYIPGFSVDNLKEILSILCSHYRQDDDNWTPLKINYIRKFVPQADLYFEELIEYGVIERSHYYIMSASAYKYRFTEAYYSKFTGMHLDNPKLERRIKSALFYLKKKCSKKYPTQNEYIRNLTIDPKAFEYINNSYTDNFEKYNYAYSSATRINNQDIYYSVDDTSGRYHSNLTNMPKTLRQFVRINGKPLTNIDVKNCQPFLSIMILTNPSKIAHFAKYPPFALLLRNLRVRHTADVKKYIDLAVNGEIYEYLFKELQARGLNYKTRDEVKRQFLIILYDKNADNPRSRKVFAEIFPEVNRIFSLVRGNERGDKFRSYQRFAILLQKIESHIILNIILNRINNEHPNIIAVTIHDSIMTSIYTSLVGIIYSIMEEEFMKYTGYKPSLKIENNRE